jgi:hypothetical protein
MIFKFLILVQKWLRMAEVSFSLCFGEYPVHREHFNFGPEVAENGGGFIQFVFRRVPGALRAFLFDVGIKLFKIFGFSYPGNVIPSEI